MDILFIFPHLHAYNSVSVRQSPCGGTEKAVIFLGEALQRLGHEVTLVTTNEELKQGLRKPDVVITQEAQILEGFTGSKRVWWCHHFSDQPIIQRNAAYGRAFADTVVTLSQCQHDDFKNVLRIPSTIIGHGVWLDEVEKAGKDPFRLIYASTPFRGLERIPALFRRIKEAESRATIAICSSMGTYGTPEEDEKYRGLFDELSTINGVDLMGALNQQQLYAEYAKASIFFYPCTWPETYCLAMDEAIAHGCVPVVSGLGALPERSPLGACDSDDLLLASIFKEMGTPDTLKRIYGLAVYSLLYADKTPRDWLAVAKKWEEEVLNV